MQKIKVSKKIGDTYKDEYYTNKTLEEVLDLYNAETNIDTFVIYKNWPDGSDWFVRAYYMHGG